MLLSNLSLRVLRPRPTASMKMLRTSWLTSSSCRRHGSGRSPLPITAVVVAVRFISPSFRACATRGPGSSASLLSPPISSCNPKAVKMFQYKKKTIGKRDSENCLRKRIVKCATIRGRSSSQKIEACNGMPAKGTKLYNWQMTQLSNDVLVWIIRLRRRVNLMKRHCVE